MNANAISMAMSAVANANAAQPFTGLDSTGESGGADFSQLLALMMGQSGSGLLGGELGGGLDSMLGGLDMSSLQSMMMTETLRSLMQSERPIVTDPTLANLLTLLKGAVQGAGSEAELLELVARMKDRLQQMAEEMGTQAAGQQMLALFAAMTQQMTGMPLNDTAYAALSAGGGQDLLQMVLSGSDEDALKLLLGQAKGLAQGQTRYELGTETQAEEVAGMNAEVVDHTVGPKADFEAAVRSVVSRYEAEAQRAADQDETLDVEALQQRVDAGANLQNTRFGTAEQAAENLEGTQPLGTQLAQPVAAALQSGREELTVKLNPEELGEVTIKLARNAEGEMNLAIIAKKPETQQLLAEQAQSLQESLKPLKVEVDSILTERQYEMLSHQQSFDQGQRQTAYNPSRANYYQGSTGAEAEPVERTTGAAHTPTSVLDAYV